MANKAERFAAEMASFVGASRAFPFWKGRVAMYAILRALGVGPEDEVVLPGYTCVMDVNPIKYLGAKPIYVDVEPVTYNVDVGLLAEKVSEKTKVIIAQHTYGYPCEMEKITAIAEECGATLIEDCCLAVGSRYRGQMCGTFGRAAYFSFQWNKPFTTGIGGMALARDEEFTQRIEQLCRDEMCSPSSKAALMLAMQRLVYRLFIYPRTTALATNLFRWLTHKGIVVGSSSNAEFRPEMAEGFFAGMSEGQAQAGLKQIRRLEANTAHRRDMAGVYDTLLSQAGYTVPAIPEHLDPVLVRYPVRIADKQRALAEAPAHGVEIGSWFECTLHPIETPLQLYDYEPGMCPVAEQAAREVVNLPTHPRTSRKTAERSVAFVEKIGWIK